MKSQPQTREHWFRRTHDKAYLLQVLVVHPDCAVEERVQTAEALGLAPRDTSLFAPQPIGMPVQRATIVPRDRAVLVRTEIARTIIHPDKAIIFPCRSGAASESLLS